MSPIKKLLIIIDGVGDMPIDKLGGKTPLEAAKTPNFDIMAARSRLGLIDTYIGKSGLPTSEESHLALFGYDPKRFNIGRGVFEVMGIGMKIRPDDICFRGNFSTIDKNGIIIDRRAGRIKNSEPLVKAISHITIDKIRFIVKKSVSHRIGIVVRGKGLSKRITSNDPKKVGVHHLEVMPASPDKKAIFTANVLNKFLSETKARLAGHPANRHRKLPANFLLIRGGGEYQKLPSFYSRYHYKACAIAGGPVYKGIAKALGMEIINVKKANALANTNLRGKIIAAVRALKKYDFVFLHIKAADSLAEDGDYIGKKRFIEKIDRQLKPIMQIRNAIVVVTSDHSTCSELKKHCIEPCPLMVYNPTINRLPVKQRFIEKDCLRGQAGNLSQINLMSLIIKTHKCHRVQQIE